MLEVKEVVKDMNQEKKQSLNLKILSVFLSDFTQPHLWPLNRLKQWVVELYVPCDSNSTFTVKICKFLF